MITVDFNRLPLWPGCRVLDIGCGSGRHTAAAYALDRAQVIGADADFQNLVAARSRLKVHDAAELHGNGRWCLNVADITRLPYPAACFDLVICSEVLEHIRDDAQAMDEIVRVLKPERHLVVSVPREWPEAICWALSPAYRRDQGGHLRIYNAHRLVRRLLCRGLHHQGTHFAHSLHSPYWWLKCLVGCRRDNLWPVRLYHRFLTWDIMQRPRITRMLDRRLNPLMGKSIVLYFIKK
ncbi:MAG: methyltransferase domain-containing protein [Desulfatitalea sp.]|nr:methyltransferase domain-containing protein [Desulfatitalea sp.]NNJ99152.1 methyltransferase domain-containing protein [Desulfatitalea sp.]